MVKISCILAIDVGTSSVKLAAVNEAGAIVQTAAVEYPVDSPQTGWFEQSAEYWTAAIIKGMAAFRNDPVRAISVTGQMHGLVAVREGGKVLHPAILWSDRRCDAEVAAMLEKFSLQQWMEMTGNRPNVSFTLAKLMWFKRHKPDLYEQASCFLLPKDYIRYWLTAEMATDPSDASATLMFDLAEKRWSSTVLEAFDLDQGKLPPILSSAALAGKLKEETAQPLGLEAGIPVYCGAGDAECQAIGNGVVHPGSWLCSIGSGGQIFTPLEEPLIDLQGKLHTLCHGVAGRWHIMGATLSAGASLSWLAKHIYGMESRQDESSLIAEAAHSPAGAGGLLFTPYLFGERTPYMDSNARGTFIGLDYNHTRADMTRAVIEGVLFSLKQSKEAIVDLGLKQPDSLIITGGPAEDALWRQIAADIFGIPVHTFTSRSGAAYGAAILAAVGLGWFAHAEDAAQAWLTQADLVYPLKENIHLYQRMYKLYTGIYPALNEIFAAANEIRNG